VIAAESAALAAHANLVRATQHWAAACEGGECWQRDGLTVAAAGGPLRSFNNVFLQDLSARSAEAFAEAAAYFRERGSPFRLRILEGDGAPSDSELAAWGFERRGGIPSLALSPLRAEPVASELAIRRVEDGETLRDHTEVVAEGFEWEPGVLSAVFTPRLLVAPEWRGYVGYVAGSPVASSQLVLADSVAGIYYVATVAEARRQGYGEAMTRHALIDGAAEGCTAGTLQASPMGEPIYVRMGFERVGYYRSYVPKEG
jgi:ribosomal protein S18 acetylase RimI-like enzyme